MAHGHLHHAHSCDNCETCGGEHGGCC
jgi:hypothetical protein